MSETVTGYIDHIIFRNEENGYTVMVLKETKEEEELTCVGSFPSVTQGASIEASGVYTHHPVYGKQFQISSFVEKCRRTQRPWNAIWVPARSKGSEQLWQPGSCASSGQIRSGSWRKNRNVWQRLKGSVKKRQGRLPDRSRRKQRCCKAMIFLQKYGISLNLGAKIYQKYRESLYTVLQENPYKLAEDISGVGFKIADEIASRIGIHADSDYRIRSGMLYTLLQASGEGHIYLPKDQLFARCAQLWEWMSPIWRNI